MDQHAVPYPDYPPPADQQGVTPGGYPPPGQPAQVAALRTLGSFLRRRALVILVPLVAVPAVAVLVSTHQTKEYTASASLVFQDSPAFASSDPNREAATNLSILQTGLIADRAKAKLGTSSEGTTQIVGDGTSNLITVNATSRSPKRAARLADAVAREFIAFRANAAQNDIAAQQARINRQLPLIKGQSGVARSQRATLRGRLRQLGIASATATPDVHQITQATPPTSPSSPHPLRSGAIGAAVGLIIGLLIAFALERLDLRVRDPREFENAFGRPILGRIPRSRALSKTPPGAELPPVEGQAFADLRARLRHHVGSPNGQAKSLVVTSAEAAEGKTTVAWHLARASAGPHQKVLVIEADLRRPGLSAKLGTDGKPGLSEVLKGQASFQHATRQIPLGPQTNGDGSLRSVNVLFAGSPANDPTELLESPEMHDVLAQASELYDLVIIDTPPTSVASDAVPLLSRTNGVLVVGRVAKSRIGAVIDLSKQLREIQATPIGVVVNSTELPRDVYSYYYARPRS